MPKFHQFAGFRLDIRSRDHSPPHFHVIGPDFHFLVEIRTLVVIEGVISRRALAEVVAWATTHQGEFMNEWERLNERD